MAPVDAAADPSIHAAEELLRRRRARESLESFISYVSPWWGAAPFHVDLCQKLEAVRRGDVQRLIVEIPPRHGKTVVISHHFPAYLLGKDASCHIIMASYGADLAHSNSRKAKQIVQSPEYQRLFPETMIGTPDQVAEWGTTRGGHMLAVGRGGGATGHGGNCLLVDDPFKDRMEADSATIRDACWEWFNSVIRTRRHGNAPIVVLHTRWHDDDLIGRLRGEGGWESVTYPAISDAGTALWPERFPTEWLEDQRQRVGPRDFAALYQQTPTPDGGGLYKREWFRYYSAEGMLFYDLAKNERHASQTWRRWAALDVAVTEKSTSDWTVLTVWAQSPDKRLWLIDMVRARMETPELLDMIAMARHRWGVATVHVESNGVGLPVFQMAAARKLPVMPFEQHRDKVSRAHAVTPWFARGDVLFPRDAPWLADLEHEMLTFPAGKHDDIADSVALGIHLADPADSAIPSVTLPGIHHRSAGAAMLPAPRKAPPTHAGRGVVTAGTRRQNEW